MQAILALEDGRVFRGKGYGARLERTGEVVFNTSISGYQEIFTDPSYAGQIVVLTNPEIGNYGTNPDDEESGKPYIEGLVVREFSPYASNYRSHQVTDEYLERHRVPVLSEIDTRALVRHLRDKGVMRGVVSTREMDVEKLVAMAKATPTIDGLDLAKEVSTKESYSWTKGGDVEERIITVPRGPAGKLAVLTTEAAVEYEGPERKQVVAYDYGIKTNILRRLVSSGCDVTVVPAQTTAEEVLALKPNGVFLSNGPGDPDAVVYARKTIRTLAGRVPVFGICLGHQLIGLALDGKTYKLKFGHHGGNHPVKHLQTGKVEITAHNHNYAVDPDSLKQSEVELTHVDLNDNTLEGLRHRNYPLFSVQYHPEASPGPHDSHYLFADFVQMMNEWRTQAVKRTAWVGTAVLLAILCTAQTDAGAGRGRAVEPGHVRQRVRNSRHLSADSAAVCALRGRQMDGWRARASIRAQRTIWRRGCGTRATGWWTCTTLRRRSPVMHTGQMCFDGQGRITLMIDRYMEMAQCRCLRFTSLAFAADGKVTKREQSFVSVMTNAPMDMPDAAKGFPDVWEFRKVEQLPFYSLLKK